MLRSLYARLRAAWPVNRVVTLLTPLAFAPAAGYVAAFVADNFPGVNITEGGVTAVFIAGATVALTIAYKWLDGWAQYEEKQMSVDVLSAQYNLDAELEERRRERKRRNR